MSRVPRIRFKGFEEDWEQRKLGEIVAIERGGSPRPIEKYITESNDGLNWIKIGDAPVQGRYITKTSEKIKKSGLSKTRQVFPGDLILSNSMSFGKPYIMGIEGCIHDGWLVIKNKDNVFDLKFLCHMLSTEYLFNQYKMFAAGSTVNNLNKELVGNASVRFPKMLVQRKIGKHLESLDHLITLHQRKLEKLKIIKKSLLENLFPQNGEKTPKIRFSGFTGDWEQRKVGAISSISTGKSNTQDRVEDGKYPFYVRSSIVERSNRYLFDEEAVLTVGDGVGTGKVFHYVDGKYDLHQRVYRMFDFEKDISAKYFFYYFSNNFYDRVMAMTAKTSVDSVRYEVISDMDIIVPHIKEQKFIADIFQNFDHLITLHQSKLGKLKKIKKSMLESMFV